MFFIDYFYFFYLFAINELMKNEGFTLIEILLVIVIIAILALVVFLNIQPQGRVYDATDSTNIKEVKSVLSAVEMYTVDNKGNPPSSIPFIPSPLIINNITSSGLGSGFNISNNSKGIPNCVQAGASSNTCLPITNSLFESQVKKYLSAMPSGPFYIARSSGGSQIVVFSSNMKKGITIDSNGFGVGFGIYKL